MLRQSLLLLAALLRPLSAQQAPSAGELLRSMDANLQFETRTAVVTMRVVDSRRTREYRMRTYGRGQDEAAVEYLAPEREKGTRMLKKGGELWIYMPSAERTQRVSGHMLRQGMMGSDISYEDMMDAADFAASYTATVAGVEQVDGRPCYRIEAVAKDAGVTYPRRIIWVDQQWRIPSRQELYALSGMKLKTWTMGDVREIDGRRYPMEMVVTDELKAGSRTELVTEELRFGVELEDEVFSRRWLERR